MVATPLEHTPIPVQMGIDAIDLMTDEQRCALAIYAANQVTSAHCVLQLHRLEKLARDTAFDISARRMVDEARHG